MTLLEDSRSLVTVTCRYIPIITVCKLQIYTFHFTTAHYRQPNLSYVWRLANAVPYPSMAYLYLCVPRCMTLSISSLFSVSYLNGLMCLYIYIYKYIYIIILNLYFRHNFNGFTIVITFIFEYLMAF